MTDDPTDPLGMNSFIRDSKRWLEAQDAMKSQPDFTHSSKGFRSVAQLEDPSIVVRREAVLPAAPFRRIPTPELPPPVDDTPTPPPVTYLYPPPLRLSDGGYNYPDTDLPDNIVHDGTVIPHTGVYQYGVTDGTGYGVGLNDYAWQFIGPGFGPITNQYALIGDRYFGGGHIDGDGTFIVYDQFHSTYTVNTGAVLTRTGPYASSWTGGGRLLIYVDYSTAGTPVFGWQLDGVTKSAPQSSPAGTYGSETIS